MSAKNYNFIPITNVDNVTFGIMDDAELLRRSAANLKKITISPNTNFKDKASKDNVVKKQPQHDQRLGTTDTGDPCATCSHDSEKCPGHTGHMDLHFYIFNVNYIDKMINWLKLICHKCHNCIFTKKNIEDIKKDGLSASLIKTLIQKIPASKPKYCGHCESLQPLIGTKSHKGYEESDDYKKNTSKIKKYDHLFIFATVYGAQGSIIDEYLVTPQMAAAILKGVTAETVQLLEYPEKTHPSVFVQEKMPVSSVVLRPQPPASTKAKTSPVTSILKTIMEKNFALTSTTYTIEQQYDIMNEIYTMERGAKIKNTKGINIAVGNIAEDTSILSQLISKEGAIRRDLLGKITSNTGRSTFTCNINLDLETIIIPLSFAMTMCIEKKITEYNIEKYRSIFNNKNIYPGCRYIKKSGNTRLMEVTNLREEDNILKVGDTLYRHILDGDIVLLNRQPTLKTSNMLAVKVKVSRDPKANSIAFNVVLCTWLDGDFDGDAGAIHPLSNPLSLAERHIQHVSNHVTSYNGKAFVGGIDDSIMHLAQITKEGVIFSRNHAARILADCGLNIHLDKDFYTGRDLVSLTLRDTPIYYKNKPTCNNDKYLPYKKLNPADAEVIIENGIHKKGILDKSSIAKGADNSLYKLVALSYGNKAALKLINTQQKLAFNGGYEIGFTMRFQDLFLNREGMKKVSACVDAVVQRANQITIDFIKGQLRPPTGTTMQKYYESLLIDELRTNNDIMPIILEYIEDDNYLFQLIRYGSKGADSYLQYMLGSIGLLLIMQELIKQNYFYGRSMPYMPRFFLHPAARGFIDRALSMGMTVSQSITTAMTSRIDTVLRGIGTAETGHQDRIAAIVVSSVIENNLFNVTIKDKIIMSFYGDDAVDTRFIDTGRFPTVSLDNEEFAAEYKYSAKDSALQSIFDGEFEQLAVDRDAYRNVLLKLENASLVPNKFAVKRRVALNVENFINQNFSGDSAPKAATSEKDMAAMAVMLDKFCKKLPFIFLSKAFLKHCKEQYPDNPRKALPPHFNGVTFLTEIHIRSFCNSRKLYNRITIGGFKIFLKQIKSHYKRILFSPGTAVGLIAEQSIMAKLTQYMLDAHHRATSGGSNKAGINRLRDTLNIKESSQLSFGISHLYFEEPHCRNKQYLQTVANKLELVSLGEIYDSVAVVYGTIGKDDTAFAADNEWVAEYMKNNFIISTASLTNWCIRIELNKRLLLLKDLSLFKIASSIRGELDNIYVAYNREDAEVPIIRIWFKSQFNSHSVVGAKRKSRDAVLGTDTLINVIKFLLSINVSGVQYIKSAKVKQVIGSRISAKGGIEDIKGEYYIETEGINIEKCMLIRGIDMNKFCCNSVSDMYKYFGIKSAYRTIATELDTIMEPGSVDPGHYQLYAKIMTCGPKPSNLNSSGIEAKNILQKICHTGPLKIIKAAAEGNATDKNVSGLDRLLLGSVPKFGTNYNNITLVPELVKKFTAASTSSLKDEI